MFRLFIRLISLAIITAASPAWAATYWEEPFNNWSSWDHAPSNPSIATCPSGFGVGTCYRGAVPHGDFVDRTYPASSEVWVRFNFRVEAFTPDYVVSKVFYIAEQSNRYPNFVLEYLFGDRRLAFAGQVVAEDCGTGGYDSCNYYPNAASVPTNNGQNYCVEIHVKYNDPGVANGMLEMWVDGTKTHNYTGRTFRGPNANNPNLNSSQAVMTMIREYVQDGTGLIWQDNLAVGNTPIGCSGNTTKTDTTPPATPSGLIAN